MDGPRSHLSGRRWTCACAMRLQAPAGGSAGCSPPGSTCPRARRGLTDWLPPPQATHAQHPCGDRGRSEQAARWLEGKGQAGRAARTVGNGASRTVPQARRVAAEAKGSRPPASRHRLRTSAAGASGAPLMTAACPAEVTTTTPESGPPQPCEQGPERSRPGLQPGPARCPHPSPSSVGDEASLCPQSQPHCSATAGPTWRWESRTGDLISCSRADTATADPLNPRTEAMETQTCLQPAARPASAAQHLPRLLVSRRPPDRTARGQKPLRHSGEATHLPSAPRARHPEILMPG